MGLRNIALVVIFSMFCILLGALIALGDFTGSAGGSLRDFLAAHYVAAQSSATLEGLTSFLPERVAVFFYILDNKLLFFGGVALFGVLMAGLAILHATQLPREKTEKPSVRTVPRWKERVRRIIRRSAQLPRTGRTLGLTWRIAGSFAGVTLLVGLLVTGAVYYLIAGAFRSQADQRAFAIATNLSDGAAGHVLAKDFLSLHALLAKYALLEGVAYTFVEDREGSVLAQSLRNVTLNSSPSERGELRDVRQKTVSFRGQLVNETRVPILDGQIGAVHVGIWNNAVEREIGKAMFPLVAWIVLIVVLGVLLALVLARRIRRPIKQLAQIADKMSKGDLDTPVGVESRDEIGDLALSLERMRASLKAALRRLQQDTRRRA